MTDENIAHLDFPTELPVDVRLLQLRILQAIGEADDAMLERVRPHWRPGITKVHFVDDFAEVWFGPELFCLIHASALIPA